jgi:RNA polymerase sigma-32 factor
MSSAAMGAASERISPRYSVEIDKFALLSLAEEQALAYRWRDQQDAAAAHKLVTSHLRLVARTAVRYRGYGLPVEELMSEGTIGMVQAVKRFDPDRGFRLATYAVWLIRAAIQNYILRSSSLVRIGTTRAQKKLFFNLSRLKGQIQAVSDGDLQPEQVASIARTLGVHAADVISMNRRIAAPDYSLNAPVRGDAEAEWQDGLADETESQEVLIMQREELSTQKALLSGALKNLNAREHHILVERWLKDKPTTLEELSQHHGVSRERVRQIEVRALEKLRKSAKATTSLAAPSQGVAPNCQVPN